MFRSSNRLQETIFDLYTERDALPSYYRAVALVASWLQLGGYVLFAMASTSNDDDLRPSKAAVVALASAMIISGYAISVLAAFISRSLLFAFDAVLLPSFSSSLLGIFVTVTNHASHRDLSLPSRAYIFVPLITSGVTTIITGLLSYIAYRKLRAIRKLDKNRRQHVQRWDVGSHVNYGDATSTSELLPMDNRYSMHSMNQPHHSDHLDIPEDEAQRRQLLRLLLTRESADSPIRATHTPSTYHIDLPGEESDLSQLLPATRPRAGSLPSSPSKFNILHRLARDRSPPVESFKNPRERRREEIERSSIISATTPGLGSEGGWSGTPGVSTGSQPSTYFNTTSRYA